MFKLTILFFLLVSCNSYGKPIEDLREGDISITINSEIYYRLWIQEGKLLLREQIEESKPYCKLEETHDRGIQNWPLRGKPKRSYRYGESMWFIQFAGWLDDDTTANPRLRVWCKARFFSGIQSAFGDKAQFLENY